MTNPKDVFLFFFFFVVSPESPSPGRRCSGFYGVKWEELPLAQTWKRDAPCGRSSVRSHLLTDHMGNRSGHSRLAESQTQKYTRPNSFFSPTSATVLHVSYLPPRRSGSVSSCEVVLRTDHVRWHWIPGLKNSSLPAWTAEGLTEQDRSTAAPLAFMKEFKVL